MHFFHVKIIRYWTRTTYDSPRLAELNSKWAILYMLSLNAPQLNSLSLLGLCLKTCIIFWCRWMASFLDLKDLSHDVRVGIGYKLHVAHFSTVGRSNTKGSFESYDPTSRAACTICRSPKSPFLAWASFGVGCLPCYLMYGSEQDHYVSAHTARCYVFHLGGDAVALPSLTPVPHAVAGF